MKHGVTLRNRCIPNHEAKRWSDAYVNKLDEVETLIWLGIPDTPYSGPASVG